MKKLLPIAEILVIVVLAAAPLFALLPYRINIFLSWEGAYRLYLGQEPYRDFGIPLGYMYWVIPAIFFKIFGPTMFSLVKAQVFINILAGLSFLSIFKSLKVQPGLRFATVLVFCLSYSFLNFWPWYNHTVIVYELISLAFLMKFLTGSQMRKQYSWLILSGIFIFFSFFTKQDGGALGFLICCALLLYNAIVDKKWLPLATFVGATVITGMLMILPFARHGFGYWFNHGQPPHTSRVEVGDLIGTVLSSSQWLKFYVFVIVLLLAVTIKDWKAYWRNKQQMFFTLLTLGILAEAAIFQVTSYVPGDNNIFFHSFAFIFILSLLGGLLAMNFDKAKFFLITTAGVLLWWSQMYWRYIERFVISPGKGEMEYTVYNGYKYPKTINHNTNTINMDTVDVPLHLWRTVNLKSFEKITMPGPTADGVERIMNMDLVKNGGKDLKVLNMSELTPLAAEVPFALERGSHYPLWFHKGVGMFDKETKMFVDRVQQKYYDMVIYEYVPYANNFYPFEVRDALTKNYKQVDSFPAPRKPSSTGWVEVYVR